MNQEVDDLKTACDVSKAIDEKLVWLDNFNKSIIDYDKICKELEEIVVKDRKDLDALIKPDGAFKATDRLVFAMDLADDIRLARLTQGPPLPPFPPLPDIFLCSEDRLRLQTANRSSGTRVSHPRERRTRLRFSVLIDYKNRF